MRLFNMRLRRPAPLAALTLAVCLTVCSAVRAEHYRVFVLTGQSNSLGTTNGSEADVTPGTDPADSRLRFFWHNVADASTSLGDSGGMFSDLQSQQGGYYPGSSTHWGPEIGFGRTLVRAGVENVAIIKASRGGGGNTNWSKAATGHMYSHVVSTVGTATSALSGEGHTFEIAGLLYLQGESDNASEADVAGTRFKELVDNLRTDLPNAASMRAVIGGIAASGGTRDTVRARHEAIATATSYIDFFPNLDLQAEVTDGLHFNKAAKLRIGERFAQAFLDNGTVDRRYGKLTFIGDSITQGGNGDHPSYRYLVFKRLAEKGVPIDAATGYRFTGSVTGPQTTPTLTTPDVNGQTFENVHDGHYGWRASWINGRIRLPANRRSNNRGEGTLLNWTGQAAPQTYGISGPDLTVAYPDPTATGTGNTGTTYTPDTVSIMIGINDLGDDPSSAVQVIADIGTLVDQLRSANPNVRIFIHQLLHTNQTQAMRDGVDAVNGQLQSLADTKNASSATSPVWIIDASTGFDPVTMTYDNVHPNAAGEVHVGDRIAAALGVIESPMPSASALPPHLERDSSAFDTTFEGNEIWDGSGYVNNWSRTGTLTESLPTATDLRIIHPSTNGRWIEGTNAGWSAAAAGSWTFEARLNFNSNANGFALWLGTGSKRIIIEIHGDRTQDNGGETFNVAQNNIDGAFHAFRVIHDADAAKYHVFHDNVRLTPLEGVDYDQTATDNRLILGDYTSGTFGNGFDTTIDHVSFTPGTWLPAGVDTDGNGMPDAWEYQYFSNLTGTDPYGDPDDDGSGNLEEFQNGTDPLVADTLTSNLPVFLIAGAGNALGSPSTTVLNSTPVGSHPAEQSGGVWFHDGSGWSTLSNAPDGSFGPEIGFARMLWDAGAREFGIVKSAVASGGNTLWIQGDPAGTAYDGLVSVATAASSSPPGDFEGLTFRSLIYLQGEDNDSSEAAAADARFSDLLDNLKTDISGASTLTGIIGEIAGSGSDRDTTRSLLASLAASRSDIGFASASGASTHNIDGLEIHYDADSLLLIGARTAAEAFDMGVLPAPLPAWANVHAWFVADHGREFAGNGTVARLGNLRNGSGNRDLARTVGLPPAPRPVTSGAGGPREALRFDGTNDLWANSSTEFGTIAGPRSVAILCRVTSEDGGFLFDGSTGTGKTRAKVDAGNWQVGCSTSGMAWNGAEETSVARDTGVWQQHVFTYDSDGSGGTDITHWIDGAQVATLNDSQSANLGGFILGSNGGSPFTRKSTDIAEVVIFNTALDAAAIAELTTDWDTGWGEIAGPPFSASVSQNPRDVARFGQHDLLEIEIGNDLAASTTLEQVEIQLSPGTRESVTDVSLVGEDGTLLGTISEPATDLLTFSPSLVLADELQTVRIAVTPKRYAALGTTLDASVINLTFSGSNAGTLVPTNADPAGELTLALVPLFSDVRTSGEGGVNTYRIPGIVCDGDGVLHSVYDHRYAGGSDLPADVDVGYARSTDGGATWSASQVILDYDSSVPGSAGNGVGDPCILWDPITDTLWVAALWSFGNNGYNGSGPGTDPADTGQYVLTKSTDGGATWSAPINITVPVKDDPNWRLIFQGPGHGLAMRDGTLVFPSQYRDASGTVRVCSVFSTDHGATWDFGSGVPTSSPQTNENTVCELDDGRLLFSMRTPAGSNGQRAWIRYQPGGATPMRDGSWESLFRLPSVPDPVCQGSVIQWTSTHRGDPSEWVLFGNPGSSSSRINYTLRISADGGDSWPVSRLLYGGSSAYSSLCILPDRSIGILFEKDNYTRITFARVEEAWLLDPATDSDGDSMPDSWEILMGLDPATDDSLLDPDGDGQTNAFEHEAGTHPLDASSFFALSSYGVGGSIDLEWHSVPGRSYAIEESTTLGAWQDVAGFERIQATSNLTATSIPLTGDPRRFVRVRALR
ncbi:G-D-S-L family lipolytic protein [Haloferula helveola]|uniref:exo-alpha-sialidase n=1 Tax=Haloferula helveola TaxID=490095 RepID=A0ABN6H1G5_9BACT|nr:G-D-S-L family lipolytic protein [Haloferula helveola]